MARHCDALCEELIVFPGSRSYSMPRPLAYYLVTTLSSEIEFLFSRYGLETFSIKYLNFGILNKSFIKRSILKISYWIFPALCLDFFIFARKQSEIA
jgi:hypothetical protein